MATSTSGGAPPASLAFVCAVFVGAFSSRATADDGADAGPPPAASVEPASPPPLPPLPAEGPPATPPAAPSPPAPPAALPPPVVLQPAPAPEPPRPTPARFGARGQFVVSNWTDILAEKGTQNGSALDLRFSPGLDYFFLENLALGLDLDFRFSSTNLDNSQPVTQQQTDLGAGARFGVNLPFGDALSLYPRLTLGYESDSLALQSQPFTSVFGTSIGSRTLSVSGPYLKVYVPLLYQVAPGFFIGAGPYLFRHFAGYQGDYGADFLRTQVSFALEVGGTLGGPDALAREPAPPAGAPEGRRFGARGEIVLDGSLGLIGGWSEYLQAPGSTDTLGTEWLAAGLDYFVANHISIGFTSSVGATQSAGIDSIGASDHYDTVTWGVEPRVGFEVPMGPSVSWYPRLGVTFGGASTSISTSLGPEISHDSSWYVGAHVEAPFLLHVSRHFFLGLGPGYHAQFTHPTSQSRPGGPALTSQNTSSDLEAAFLVGGWLH